MVFLHVSIKYANDVLKIFRMINYKPCVTPIETGTKLSKKDDQSKIDPTMYKRLIGSLMYLTATRPNIMFAVSLISRFMENTKEYPLANWKENPKIYCRNNKFWYPVYI